MGSQSQATPSAPRRSTMLFRRARSGLVLIALFWLWMLFGAADFVAALFGSPIHAALAVFALGALTLISLLFLPICIAYLVLNRPKVHAAPSVAPQAGEAQGNGLAPVIRMMPRRAAVHGAALTSRAAVRGAALTSRAAAKWRDRAS
ncbi:MULTISPECIES: hypothetical protein [Arthrobacter]|uniref:Uncharacterized protein n=1 Tax=Arthrobacter jinronghuae TaxID=2964609 RepID=A0ABT1NQQ2_9MICC|nr:MULTISPECIES: hypothetical protein [Arthrobacter]MCQ1948851.1 hypothetical protein [Arthrobacter jinronghuae]MCQ1952177.1 hypothetical protein [Arthrobacter sp. zg-Y238]MCQ1955688.1 hypothetical protein [Arthrobacter jinronghuae]UWX78342.1 hypothetical protein N2K98_15490 [Arthrobacter jinronghuae]